MAMQLMVLGLGFMYHLSAASGLSVQLAVCYLS
jgi:hypothetical protein